jgi:hypothetical protein
MWSKPDRWELVIDLTLVALLVLAASTVGWLSYLVTGRSG